MSFVEKHKSKLVVGGLLALGAAFYVYSTSQKDAHSSQPEIEEPSIEQPKETKASTTVVPATAQPDPSPQGESNVEAAVRLIALGKELQKKKKTRAEAIEKYREAARLHPENNKARIMEALNHLRLLNYAEAAKAAELAIKQKDNCSARAALAISCTELGRLEEAKVHAEAAFERKANCISQLAMGKMLHSFKKYQVALEHLSKVRISPYVKDAKKLIQACQKAIKAEEQNAMRQRQQVIQQAMIKQQMALQAQLRQQEEKKKQDAAAKKAAATAQAQSAAADDAKPEPATNADAAPVDEPAQVEHDVVDTEAEPSVSDTKVQASVDESKAQEDTSAKNETETETEILAPAEPDQAPHKQDDEAEPSVSDTKVQASADESLARVDPNAETETETETPAAAEPAQAPQEQGDGVDTEAEPSVTVDDTQNTEAPSDDTKENTQEPAQPQDEADTPDGQTEPSVSDSTVIVPSHPEQDLSEKPPLDASISESTVMIDTPKDEDAETQDTVNVQDQKIEDADDS